MPFGYCSTGVFMSLWRYIELLRLKNADRSEFAKKPLKQIDRICIKL